MPERPRHSGPRKRARDPIIERQKNFARRSFARRRFARRQTKTAHPITSQLARSMYSAAMANFTCGSCGREFSVKDDILAKYEGWVPKVCMTCKRKTSGNASGRGNGVRRDGGARRGGGGARRPSQSRASGGSRASRSEQNLTVAEVLIRYTGGPETGVFTDGAADPNPGPGGWGAVYVRDGQIIAEAHGHSEHTTNNRMELTALIEGYKLVPEGESAQIWSDSQLCVNTINQWAAGWAKRGWRRKSGEIKNLELVKELYALAQERPELSLTWIKAHSGNRWNEYADALATAYRRAEK